MEATVLPGPGVTGLGREAAVIWVSGLRKRYGSLEAVRCIDLSVHAGEVFAFLGPNGAGNPAPAVRVLLTSVYAPEVPGRLTLV